METVIHNQNLSVTISSLGAEAMAIERKDLGCAYLWQGDARFWGGRSPVLFPMVCAAMNGEITVDGQKHAIGNHGFARKTEFERIAADEGRAVFRLLSDEATLKMYPFRFQLTLDYAVTGNALTIDYEVLNTDDREIHFQIGTHPGFNVPLERHLAFEDYRLEFEQPETLERRFLNAANVQIPDRQETLGPDLRELPLTRGLFAAGALVFPSVRSRSITLRSAKGSRGLTVRYENLPQLGIWQAKDAPFVCIEPWHGLADRDGFTGEFKNREGIVSLAPGEYFRCRLGIETF